MLLPTLQSRQWWAWGMTLPGAVRSPGARVPRASSREGCEFVFSCHVLAVQPVVALVLKS